MNAPFMAVYFGTYERLKLGMMLTKYWHTTLFKVPYHHLKSTTQPSSKYYTTLFKVVHEPSSKYHTTILKVPHSKYHTTIFKVPYQHLQSTTQPSSKYHITLFKVVHNPLHSTAVYGCVFDFKFIIECHIVVMVVLSLFTSCIKMIEIILYFHFIFVFVQLLKVVCIARN